MHLRHSMMADANTTFECQVQFPELRAMRSQQENFLSKSLETRGLLDALCNVLIDAGGAEALGRGPSASFRGGSPISPLWLGLVFVAHIPEQRGCIQRCLLFRKQEGLCGLAHSVQSLRHLHGRGVLSVGPAQSSCLGRRFCPRFPRFSTNTWETSPSAHEFREEAASAVINGRLYVCGGEQYNPGSPSTSLDCFDPVLGIWQALPSMSQGREGHAAAVVGAGLYVCGGSSGGRRTHRSAEVFDTVTNTWQSLPAMVHTRCWAGAAVIRGHVYMVGGDGSCSSSERLPPTGNWQELPPMNEARMRFSTAVIADRLYVCGGFGLTSLERFDPEVGVWELLQPMLEARDGASVAVLHGQLYVCRGEREPLSSVERFDPAHNTWERLTSMSHARTRGSAVEIDGRLFVFGGERDDREGLNSAEWFEPARGRWKPLREMSQGRICPFLAVISC